MRRRTQVQPSQTVYVVVNDSDDEGAGQVFGVFSTEDNARAFIKTQTYPAMRVEAWVVDAPTDSRR